MEELMDITVVEAIQMPVKNTTLVNMVEFAYLQTMGQNVNAAIKILKGHTAR